MDAQTCILTRRSVRKFDPATIDHELMEQIISLASYAPSWKNTQISRYIAIESPEVREAIAEQYCSEGHHNKEIIRNCPLLIAQTFVKSRSGFERDGTYSTDREGGWQYYDCGIAAQTFCLAAHEKGLGTVILGIFDRPALEKHLNLPENQELVALIALGHPADQPAAPRRKGVEDLLTWR